MIRALKSEGEVDMGLLTVGVAAPASLSTPARPATMVAMKVRFAVAPQRGTWTSLEFAEALEASGFDGIWLSDLPIAPVLDPLLGLALAAGRTRRLRLGANVVPLGRNPFLLAKELAQLDQLSGGRLLLSFVTGLGQPGEREALGLDGAGRAARCWRRSSASFARGGRARR